MKVYANSETGTIEWPNGADFAPEFLHETGQEVGKSAKKSCEHNALFGVKNFDIALNNIYPWDVKTE